jgi:enediyne biosynthesis protein E4
MDLEGVKSNRDAIGAQVQVTAGKLLVYREKQNGVGFGSSDSPTLHFGLGKAPKIDEVKVTWPSGATQAFTDVPIDTRITLREGESWKKWNKNN